MKKKNATCCNETCMKTALFFMPGGMAGAILALLFAPQSGKETREAIQEAGEEFVDKVEALPGDFISRQIERAQHLVQK